MDLKFTQNGLIEQKETFNKDGEIFFVSKSAEVENAMFDNVVQIIDETGNEMNCTVDKFIEIFDNQGLEGFIL